MNTTEKNYAFDLTLFKIIGYYQMIDPNSKKIFGYNIYNVINMAIVIFTSIVTVIGLSGFFYKPDNITYEKISFKDIQILFYLACIMIGNLKIAITIYNAKAIWKSFNVAHESFLSNKYWKQNKHKINNCGKKFARIFPWYFFMFLMTAFAWSIVPIVVNNHVASKETQINENIYITNIANMRYPITAKTYNKFYKIFYVSEFIVVCYSAYGLAVFDLLILGLLQLMATHYEIIASAYENFICKIENENGKLSNEEIQKEFVLIILDCQTVYEQLETIYGIARPIVLIYMVGDSIGMITMPFLIVMFYMQDKSIFNSNVIAFSWTLFVVGIQLYMYCSLLQYVNEQKEDINFGLYSCDWTWLDIEIKKLILLAMRMNSSNNLKMNVTFTKFIDLPMFANILD
ncbi:odorant receptor 67a-like [Rhopalosiphum padi]|uniref:odorant receptor 67a-like n=1 Tax=Rhopalosiphum padi TaxID=40932 RepID=UPI00298E1E18|nr:odorant receptor 67a-like [Rhopalosiphum padi]